MLVARAHGYETNPIGGFEAEKLAETFGLDQSAICYNDFICG